MQSTGSTSTPRLQATQLLLKLIDEHISLSELKREINRISASDKSFVQELCYGVARWYFRLSFLANQFLKKPLKKKDTDIYILILLGIYQIEFTRVPHHAAIAETVEVARRINKEWATKLINAVLRQYLRKKTSLLPKINTNEVALYAHPEWLIKKINYWQSYAPAIFEANNKYPPLCLRINERKITRDNYIHLLQEQGIASNPIPFTRNGIELTEATEVIELPLFSSGGVSVQDGSAQLASELLGAKEGETILDACAAPGGKTGHILELTPSLKNLVAIDNDPKRLNKVAENLARLNLNATLICHDVTNLSWWDGNCFDRILLDVPCSATGVIRRHPDIKLLRRPSDLTRLKQIQYQALTAVWQTLKPGGYLLYVTCSIFPEENELLVTQFINQHNDCVEENIDAEWGIKVSVGRQILPGMQNGMDGFYYAKLRRIKVDLP